MVRALNSLLRGEKAAVAAYDRAMDGVDDAQLRPQLETCRQSHLSRAHELALQVVEFGGRPPSRTSLREAVASTAGRLGSWLGRRATLKTLHWTERYERERYLQDLRRLKGTARRVVEDRLWPEQRRTEQLLSAVADTPW